MTLFGEIQRDKVLAGWLMDLFTYRQGARRKKKSKKPTFKENASSNGTYLTLT
jgi:hypothetical protein